MIVVREVSLIKEMNCDTKDGTTERNLHITDDAQSQGDDQIGGHHIEYFACDQVAVVNQVHPRHES